MIRLLLFLCLRFLVSSLFFVRLVYNLDYKPYQGDPEFNSHMKSRSFFSNFKLFLLYFFSLLIIINYIFLIIWSYCYSLYVCYLLAAAFGACIIVYYLHRSKRQAVKFLLLGLVLFVVLLPFNLRQYNRRAEALQLRVYKKGELSTKEKLGVYGCLVMMTVFDIIPFPETAVENFHLFFPVEGNQRVFTSNSILNSPSILHAVAVGEKNDIGWNKWNYVFNSDFRYSLAFDPCTVRAIDHKTYKDVVLTTHFGYRKDYVTIHANTFLGGMFSFRVDEGLFWYLQEKGWLHPYTAIWKARLKN